MSVFSCTSENEIEDITTASKIVDEEIVAEQTINEIETADYVSESPSDLETDQAAGLIDSILVGTQVGNRIPEFKIIYEDGTEVTSTSLIENGKPVFMYFAASWCQGCTRELAELK